MNVTITEAGPCKKVLKFEIPKETIESEFEKKTALRSAIRLSCQVSERVVRLENWLKSGLGLK